MVSVGARGRGLASELASRPFPKPCTSTLQAAGPPSRWLLPPELLSSKPMMNSAC